jgi:glucose uptake protein GlcU
LGTLVPGRTEATGARLWCAGCQMTALLSIAIVVCWGAWIPTAQVRRGIPQRTRTLYAAAGNLALAAGAFLAGSDHLTLGWRAFWLPIAGGVVWTAGSIFAFRASQLIGLARAAGSWTPLNIVMAFVWGAALFGELSGLRAGRWAALGAGVVLVAAGLTVVARSQEAGAPGASARRTGGAGYRRGLLYAIAAGLLWGTYFVPAQWAKVPAEVGNLPLAFGIFAGGLALMAPGGAELRLSARAATVQLAAGVLFGAGNLALLALVARVGTGTGFTIAQLSLVVNAAIGIWVFKMPPPGSRAARLVLTGVVIAGTGGCLIGALH